MAVLVLVVLILAMSGYSDANYCVCRSDVSESACQKALDYACGAGADCNPILQSGSCFQPNTVRAHCSYAVNSYFQRKGQGPGTCDFSGAATPTATDPSTGTCTFPSSAGSAGTTPSTGTTPGTGTGTTPPGTGTGTGTGTGGTGTGTGTGTGGGTGFPSPTGIIGGGMGGSGLGPSGTGINTDSSDGGFIIQKSTKLFFLVTLWFSGLVFWWG
ncbi:hypothetical protein IFM89_008124 [Coptis chinensis]|uniref:X8 domain-containing protein n=1 Tax=Coptis chinensis TaxID=261450 RepID=A0A835IV75_9MAGN|nr:hypothetical protein IFM89_008124 [Coptis chinensis]